METPGFLDEAPPETLFQSVDFIDLNRSSAKPSGRFLAIDDRHIGVFSSGKGFSG
jgi:hypothetical protein